MDKFSKVIHTIGIFSLDFLIILVGTWILPQLPQKVHLLFSLTILSSACYLSMIWLETIGVDLDLGIKSERKSI